MEIKPLHLIGLPIARLEGRKLPSNQQVLQLFLYYKQTNRCRTTKDCAYDTLHEVETKWSLAGIPVRAIQNSVVKLEKLYEMWQALGKSAKRKKSATQQDSEEKFKSVLCNLFDISRHDVMDVLTEDKKYFLISQQKPSRRGLLPVPALVSDPSGIPGNDFCEELLASGINVDDSAVDSQDAAPDMLAENSDAKVEDTDEKNLIRSTSGLTVSSTNSSQLSNSSSMKRTDSNFEDELENPPPSKKIKLIDDDVAGTADRIGISNAKATLFTAAILRRLGLDLDNYSFSCSTFRRARMDFRQKMAAQLKLDLKLSKILVLHWDGKLLPDLTGEEKVDRLPVVVTALGAEQLLGAPKLDAGTGSNMADAILEMMDYWSLGDCVKALCFDTTSSNTGPQNGACALLQQKLGRNLLLLACRHHISELYLRSVVEVYWKGTTCPTVPLFQRFKKNWDQIDKQRFMIGMDDPVIAGYVTEQKDYILLFISTQFQVSQPRNDYRELLELACIFLGGVPPRGIRFKKPGPNHHARWLSKAIYALKIFMFKDQFFKNTQRCRDVIVLREICIFVVLFYVEVWFTASCAIKAPQSDLLLIQNLIKFREINFDVSTAVLKKTQRHLWYLTADLAPLAFFDERVSLEVKAKMVQAIKECEDTNDNVKRLISGDELSMRLVDIDISYFITKSSMRFFELTTLPDNFLDENPVNWKNHSSFIECLTVLRELKVVNDVAERGVALVEEYNGLITKDEEQYQYLLQVVQAHRKKYPNYKKMTFRGVDEDDENTTLK